MNAISKVVCIFATTTSDYMPMKQILHTIYTLIVCALLVPCSALASDKSEATERQLLSDQSLIAVASQPLALEQSAPQVEVRDGAIVPLFRSHTEVCSLQTSPSAPCASSFLQSQDNLASKIGRLLTFATVSP